MNYYYIVISGGVCVQRGRELREGKEQVANALAMYFLKHWLIDFMSHLSSRASISILDSPGRSFLGWSNLIINMPIATTNILKFLGCLPLIVSFYTCMKELGTQTGTGEPSTYSICFIFCFSLSLLGR